MQTSPRLEPYSATNQGALDLSVLETRLLSSTPRRQPSSWGSSSPSDGESLGNTRGSEIKPEEFAPYHTSTHFQDLRERFSDLCSSCIRRFASVEYFECFSKHPVPTTFTFIQDIDDLEISARECKFCKEVWRHYDFCWSYQREDSWKRARVNLEPETSSRDGKLRGIKIHVAPVQEQDRDYLHSELQEGHFWTHTDEGDPAALKIPAREVNSCVHSPQALSRAKGWINTCLYEHVSCGGSSSQELPTRLLNVSKTYVFLQPTEELREAQYAALSYCWGGDQYQPNQLKGGPAGNFDKFLEGVPLSAFPQTLQDAITVTRELGLRFIWIDSACIIQNDEEDKRNEIAKMRRIYANSHVTIVASTARTAADGFLQDRDPPPPPIKVPFPCAEGLLGSMYLRGRVSSGWTQYAVESSYTDKRAWTMEEKLLSPRVLMYTDKQVRWVCNTMRDCDGGHIDSYHNDLIVDPGRVTYVGSSVNPDRLDEYMRASLISTDDEHERFKIAWSILVTCYTRRTVTHVKDRLRAIGGIAEEFSRRTGYYYLAGLWRETLAYDLLWKEMNPIDVPRPEWDTSKFQEPSFFLKEHNQSTAPTWSWARGHYPITTWMHGRIIFQDFSILGCDVELQSEKRPFGDILSGSVTLRGRVKQVYILDSHKVQIPVHVHWGIVNSHWVRIPVQTQWRTIGTANLDPFRPNPVSESRQEVLLINFGTYNDDNENVGLVLSPLAGSAVVPKRSSHTRMGIYTAWSIRASEFARWDICEITIT